jgi:DNA-binding NtrC family response regulator
MSMAAPVTNRNVSPLEILVVEEQPELLASIRDALGKRGHRVTAALDGQQALDRLDARRFDVAICDFRGPRPDGVELLRRIHPKQPESDLIVMNTAGGSLETSALELGATSLHQLQRPFDLERLMHLVGRVAEQRRLPPRTTNAPMMTSTASTSSTLSPPYAAPASHVSTNADVARQEGGRLDPLVNALKHFERGYLLRALDHGDWQRTKTSEMLGISRKTLWQKLKQHRIAESEAS